MTEWISVIKEVGAWGAAVLGAIWLITRVAVPYIVKRDEAQGKYNRDLVESALRRGEEALKTEQGRTDVREEKLTTFMERLREGFQEGLAENTRALGTLTDGMHRNHQAMLDSFKDVLREIRK